MKNTKSIFQIIRVFNNTNRKIQSIETICFVTAHKYFYDLKTKFKNPNIIDNYNFTINNNKITYKLVETICIAE